MHKRYLKENDKQQLQNIQGMINHYLVVISGLEKTKQEFLQMKAIEYQLDPREKWDIDTVSGRITKRKAEQKPKQNEDKH